MSDFKVISRHKLFSETGSPFDTTDLSHIRTRAGGHDTIPAKPLDVSAFSYSKRTDKPSPHDFQKKGTGTGGTMVLTLEITSIILLLTEYSLIIRL